MRVEIQMGHKSIAVEGDLTEVQTILSEYWQLGAESLPDIEKEPNEQDRKKEAFKKKNVTKRRPARLKSADANGVQPGQMDANDLANNLKKRPDFINIKRKILDISGKWKDKCMLVAVVADSPISSGDVKRVMDVLRIKSSLPTLSRTLSGNSSEFLTESGPNNSTLYTVTESAKEKFLQDIMNEDE